MKTKLSEPTRHPAPSINWRNFFSKIKLVRPSLPTATGILACVMLIASASGGLANQCQITIPAGERSLIANQLDHAGGNTLVNVFGAQLPDLTFVFFWKGSGDDPANTAQLLASANYDIYIYDSTVIGGGPATSWFNEDESMQIDPNTVYLNPGQGVFVMPSAPVTLNFTGTPHVPVLPATLPYGAAHWNLLSRQTNDLGTWDNVTGLAPAPGAQVCRWNMTTGAFTDYTYSGGAWSPSAPTLGVGEAAFFLVSSSADKYKTNNAANLNIAGSWVNNAVPGVGDFAVWNSIVSAPNTTNALGADMTWGGIKILNPGGPVTLTGGNTLSLNGVTNVGIDMSSASQDLTIHCPVSVIFTQTWNVASSRMLAVDSLVVNAPFRIGGAGRTFINNMECDGVYPADFTGSSYTEVGSLIGNSPLQVDGPATLALTGSDSSTGPVTLADGATLQLLADSNKVFGAGTVVTASNATVTILADALTPDHIGQIISFASGGLYLGNVTVNVPGTNAILNLGVVTMLEGPIAFAGQGTIHIHGINKDGVYPADFTGSSYGSPSEIEWNFGDGSKSDLCGPIAGVSEVIKEGNHTLALTGTNNYDGLTVVSDGALVLAGDNSAVTNKTVVSGPATLALVASANNTAGGVCAALGSVELDLTNGATVQLIADSNTVFGAGTTVTATNATVTIGAGPLTPGLTNQTLTFAGGGLKLGNANINVPPSGDTVSLGSIAYSGPIQIGGGGRTDIGGITGDGIYPTDFTGSSYGTPSEIEWSFGDSSTCGPIANTGGLNKLGNDVLVLTGVNTYTGPTVISNGALVVNGSLLGGGPVTVAGGTLHGSGVITGPVTVQANACIAVDGMVVVNIGSSGLDGVIMTVSNNLSLSGTAWFGINRTNTHTSDRVIGISTVTYGGTLTVTNLGPALQAGDTFTLFSAAHYANSFATLNLPTLNSNLVWDTSSLPVNGSIRVASLPVTYAGLVHSPLGSATLNYVPTNTLVVVNIGTNGLDGIAISMPTNAVGWAAQWEPLDPDGTVPIGAYLQEQVIGTCGSVTNGVLATLTTTKAGTSNFVLYADFSPIGATNFTVQAYYGGNLVAETTQVGPAGPTGGSSGWPDDGEIDWSSGWPTVKPTWHNDPIWFTPTVGPAVLADSVMIIPGGVSGPGSVSSATIQASQIPSITITNESVTVLYAGLRHTSQGNATLNYVPTNTLIIGNIGSSGQDGVTIALPGNVVGWNAEWEPLDPTGALPVGAYFQMQAIGTAGAITNGSFGMVQVTKIDNSNAVVTADFSPLGVSTFTLQVFTNGNCLAGQLTGLTNGSQITAEMCPGGGGKGNLILDNLPTMHLSWDLNRHHWPKFSIDPVTSQTLLAFIPEGDATISSVTAVQILASQIPSITITNESVTVRYAGLDHTSLGNATFNYVPTNTLILGNLGADGIDGVAILIPTNTTGWGAQWEPLDPDGTLPIGAYLQEQVIGTCGSATNGVLATLTTTKAGASNFVLYADFSPIGATNFTVQAYYGTNLVAQATQVGPAGPTGGSSGWPDDWEVYCPGPIGFGIRPTWHNRPIWFTPTVGPAVLADRVMIIPEGVSGPSSVSSVTIQASQIPSISITNESVTVRYAGLNHTSLGNATLNYVPTNTLILGTLGSSGQDGVSIALGDPPSPNGFEWQCHINYLGDASQHVGGMISLNVEGTRDDSQLSLSRVTYSNPTGDGIHANYDYSGAFLNGPIVVNYWLNGVLVASDVVTNNQVTLVYSDWPTTYGVSLTGPYRITRSGVRPMGQDTGPYGQSHSNSLDAGVIPHPWRVWRNGVWLDVDAIDISTPTADALSGVFADFQAGGGGISSITITDESLVSAQASIQVAPVTGGLNLSWPQYSGWILQQTTNLSASWNDMVTTNNSYQVVPTPTQPNQFYRLRLGQ